MSRYSKFMWADRVQRLLLTRDAEADPGFLAEILRLSHIGLQVLAAVQIAVACVMVGASILLDPREGLLSVRLGMGAAIVGLGLVTLAASRLSAFDEWSRAVAGSRVASQAMMPRRI